MKTIADKTYANLSINTPGVVENIRFERCTFGPNLELSMFIKKPSDGMVIKNCEFIECEFVANEAEGGGLWIGDVYLEDLLLQDCRVTGKDWLILEAVKMRHITIKGSLLSDEEPNEEGYKGPLNLEMAFTSSTYKLSRALTEDDYRKYGISPTAYGAYTYRKVMYENRDDLDALLDDYTHYIENTDWMLDISEASLKYWNMSIYFPQEKVKHGRVNKRLMDVIHNTWYGRWHKGKDEYYQG